MSSKEQNEVAVEKIDNDKASGDAKCELKGTKRAAEVSDSYETFVSLSCCYCFVIVYVSDAVFFTWFCVRVADIPASCFCCHVNMLGDCKQAWSM